MKFSYQSNVEIGLLLEEQFRKTSCQERLVQQNA